MSDFESDVPKKGQESLDVRLPVGGIAFRQQHHDVDVRTRVQLAAPIAADGNEREVVGKLSGVAQPRGAQRDIDQAGAVAHQVLDGIVRDKAIL